MPLCCNFSNSKCVSVVTGRYAYCLGTILFFKGLKTHSKVRQRHLCTLLFLLLPYISPTAHHPSTRSQAALPSSFAMSPWHHCPPFSFDHRSAARAVSSAALPPSCPLWGEKKSKNNNKNKKGGKKSPSIWNPLVKARNRAAMKRPIKVAKELVSPHNITFPAQGLLPPSPAACINMHVLIWLQIISLPIRCFARAGFGEKGEKMLRDSDQSRTAPVLHQHPLFLQNA